VAVDVLVDRLPPVGYRAIGLAAVAGEPDAPAGVTVTDDEQSVTLSTGALAVGIDRATGNLAVIADRRSGAAWGGERVGRLSAVREAGSDVTLRIAADAEASGQQVLGVEVAANGPLFASVRIRKTILNAPVTQTVTLWASEPRLDLETSIKWWGARDWQVRLGLPSVPDPAGIAYGTPFYGSGWTEVVPDAAPRNPDEILPEDYHRYREVQRWLHLRGAEGGLTLVTHHPGFFYGDHGLEAVLMRTSPSCGDKRLYWENAGERVYRVSFLPGPADWRAADVQHRADALLRPPAATVTHAAGGGSLPDELSLLRIAGDGAALASLAPASDGAGSVARLFETRGERTEVTLSGPLAAGDARLVNLLEEEARPCAGEPGAWTFELAPWRIQTVRLGGAGERRP
jgi:alpha-mannosidase